MTYGKKRKKKGVGRAGAQPKGERGDRDRARDLTDMGYHAYRLQQGAGLGQVHARAEQEARQLARAHQGMTLEQARARVRQRGLHLTAATDIKCAALASYAHLESKFWDEPQFTRDRVMELWREQVQRDAPAHLLPCVLHGWDHCREAMVIEFPRGKGRAWRVTTVSQWIHELEECGYDVTDPLTGVVTRHFLSPDGGSPEKDQAMKSVHPRDRLRAARWARELDTHAASPEGKLAALDALRRAEHEGTRRRAANVADDWRDPRSLDGSHEVAVRAELYALEQLEVTWTRGREYLYLRPRSGERPRGQAGEEHRDYTISTAVFIAADGYVYDWLDVVTRRAGGVERTYVREGAVAIALDPDWEPQEA